MRTKIQITICTFRRTELLKDLATALLLQAAEIDAEIRICFINNDAGSSSPVWSELVQLGCIVVVEPRQGIGFARNRGLSIAGEDEWVLFFDDDQKPGDGWLKEFANHIASGAEWPAVGPVSPLFESNPPVWGRGWAWGEGRALAKDGSVRKFVGFGNVALPPLLVANDAFRVRGRFLRGPGEDTFLSSVATQLGYRFVFLKAAGATEPVDRERLRARWVFRRCFLNGLTFGRVSRRQGFLACGRASGSIAKRVTLSIVSLAAEGGGTVGDRLIRSGCQLVIAIGTLVGLLSFT